MPCIAESPDHRLGHHTNSQMTLRKLANFHLLKTETIHFLVPRRNNRYPPHLHLLSLITNQLHTPLCTRRSSLTSTSPISPDPCTTSCTHCIAAINHYRNSSTHCLCIHTSYLRLLRLHISPHQ